jgi:UDP-glucuronate 4-epimerase
MTLENKKYLITGGAGFIGSHLTNALLKKGANVIVIDNFDNYYDIKRKRNNIKPFKKLQNFTFIQGSILNKKKLSQCFDHKLDAVIHLAAQAGVRNSIKNPDLYYRTNVIGTLKILEEVKKMANPHIIYASSSSVYGNSQAVPFLEDNITNNQISPYASSKKSAELLCQTYSNIFDIKTTVLRFFTVYGPGGRPDMAPYLFMKAALDNTPILKFGSGESMRDYTYIDDIVNGIIKSLEQKFDFEIFNLGNNNPITLNQFIAKIEKVSGKKIKQISKKIPTGDVSITCASIDKARKKLDWTPHTSLESGLNKLYKWMNKYV